MRSVFLTLIVATMALAAPLISHKRQGVDGVIGSAAAGVSTIVTSLDGAIGTASEAGKGNVGSVGAAVTKIEQETGAVIAEDTG